jgi:hypothetical protein
LIFAMIVIPARARRLKGRVYSAKTDMDASFH